MELDLKIMKDYHFEWGGDIFEIYRVTRFNVFFIDPNGKRRQWTRCIVEAMLKDGRMIATKKKGAA